jgi:BirA family biotin operon repressor/biotin-[acetyl-CoA-carboxylase] ligase
MTALIAPPVAMQHALSLSLTTAIAVQSAIASVAGFRVRDQIDIRWPNDLLLTGKDGTARKCGGILIDTASNHATSSAPATLRYAVIGIGINVNHASFPPEIDAGATSLRQELPDPSQPLRREPLAAAILLALDQEIRRLTSNLEPRTSDLTQFSSWISGKRVRVEARNDDPNDPAPGGYTGITAGLDPSGFLLVHGDDGQLHTVLSGGLREP